MSRDDSVNKMLDVYEQPIINVGITVKIERVTNNKQLNCTSSDPLSDFTSFLNAL